MSIIRGRVSASSPLRAMDYYLGVGFDRGYIRPIEIKEVLREEILILKDILDSWGGQTSVREITYRTAVRQADGSLKLTERTQTMNKEQVKNLIDNLERILLTI